MYPFKLRLQVFAMQRLCGYLGPKLFFSYLNDKCSIHWTISSVITTLCFGIKSITEPGIHWLVEPQGSIDLCLAMARVTVMHCGTWLFLWVLGTWLQMLTLAQQAFYWLSIFPAFQLSSTEPISLPFFCSQFVHSWTQSWQQESVWITVCFDALWKGGGKKGKKYVWLFCFFPT